MIRGISFEIPNENGRFLGQILEWKSGSCLIRERASLMQASGLNESLLCFLSVLI